MSAISGFISTIRNAVYGEQVRGAIANAIEQCYDDVSSPALNTAAFATAIAEAYADGFLDIQEKSTIAGMTNEKIIYRYTGNAAGYVHNALYYYDGTAWKPIGSGVQLASTAAGMTDTSAIYKYTGTETGYYRNALYYYNGTNWVPVSVTDQTLSKGGVPADAVAVGSILGIGAYDISQPSLWSNETIYGGVRQASTKHIALVSYLPTNITHITCEDGYESLLYRYTANGVYDGYWSAEGFSKTATSVFRSDFDIPQDNNRYIITVRANPLADITTSAAENVSTNASTANGLIQNVSQLMQDVSEVRSVVGESYGLTVSEWTESSCIVAIDFSNNGTSGQGAMTVATSVLKASGFVYVGGAEMLELPIPKVSDTAQPQFGICFYDKNKNAVEGRAAACSYGRTTGEDAYEVRRFYIPQNVKYFRTTYWTDSSTVMTGSLAPQFYYNLIKIPEALKPITHEMPVEDYMQNSIRRARQLTDIKWTPKVNIPRYSMMYGSTEHFLDWFYADKEYVGIPYSGAGGGEGSDWSTAKDWGYAHNWVGGCIPFDAFVTAARYPNSIFSETVNQSTYDYNSSPFGIVCTALVNYAVNGSWPLRGIGRFFDGQNGEFLNTNRTVGTSGANQFAIGDFLYTAEHVIIITDILRDKDGNVTHIEMSEATTVGNGNNSELGTQLGGVARRKMWDFPTFKSSYSAYKIYRRPSFFGIPYEPSKYVDTGNEGDQIKVVDLPCIPYLGHTAIYKKDYIHNSKILIGATGFTSLVVTKDGEAFGTFDVTGLTEVSVGFTAVGEYQAYLKKGNVKTMSCMWSVVE